MSNSNPSVGELFANQLFAAMHDMQHAPLQGARRLPVLTGIDPTRSVFTEPQENVLVNAITYLCDSGRVFTYGDAIVMEVAGVGTGPPRLVTLSDSKGVVTGANSILANLFVCKYLDQEFPPPPWFTTLLLRAEPLLAALPRINVYAPRPLFDNNFTLRSAGWHEDIHMLIHGPELEPVVYAPGSCDVTALMRLPIHLRTLLSGFCFRADADVVNTVAALLTGLLVNHVIRDGKALLLVDGNQPGLGKTLLVRAIGIVLDGFESILIPNTPNDEELSKCICAALRGRHHSVLVIDNAKTKSGTAISSPTIEANAVAPELALRILKTSDLFCRPNDLMWAITMNSVRASADVVSRGMPIQLAYEGRPEQRQFAGPDPIAYAMSHRLDILSELAGMVIFWNQQGRPTGTAEHRLKPWAGMVGGILHTAGFPEFLSNAIEAASEFNVALADLAALAEAVIDMGGPFIEIS